MNPGYFGDAGGPLGPSLGEYFSYEASHQRAQQQAALNNAGITTNPIPPLSADPRKAQLLALFDLSDKRGQDLLIAIAVIHADRYPKVPK